MTFCMVPTGHPHGIYGAPAWYLRGTRMVSTGHPHGIYGAPAWYQNFAGMNRALNGVYTRYWKLYNGPTPQIMTPIEFIECQLLKIAHKIHNDNYPIKRDIFRSTYGKRVPQGITRPKIFNGVRKEAFSVRIIDDWNKISHMNHETSTQFAINAKNYAMSKHRGDVVPNNRERISQRTPYF